MVKKLPNIEKMEKKKEIFIEVLFCLRYEMNPAADEVKIIKVEVSIAIFIGIRNKIVIILTNNTPPPIPAITAITPAKNPNVIKIEMRIKVISIEKENSNSS